MIFNSKSSTRIPMAAAAAMLALSAMASAPDTPADTLACGRVYPERHDDLAWENDLVGFRAYGPETQRRGEKGFGYDIFLKRGTTAPVLEMLYAYQQDPNDPRTYHKDYGYGMDCYAVGPSLGAGVTAVYSDGRLLYPWCYKTAQVLQNGPRRFKARLEFEPTVIEGDTVREVRIIQLDAGSHLNKTQVVYEGLRHPVTLATGVSIHDETGLQTYKPRYLSYVDPTTEEGNGKVFMGIVFERQPSETRRLDTPDGRSHAVGLSRYCPGDTLTYYWGFAWNRTDIPTIDLWNNYLATFASRLPEPRVKATLSKAGLGWSATSVNTAVFRGSSLVTHGDTQYISYYDPEGYVVLGKRPVGTSDWTLRRTQYKGNVRDAHNVISIGVDGQGYIHASFDHHGHPLRYARSTAPGELTLGPLEPMTGVDEADVTYPEFYNLAGGDLLFAYRSGASGRGNLVLNRYSVADRKWHRVQDVLIDGENARNAYWQLYVDPSGIIHLSWVWRETWLVETNHDLCYARSRNNGVTWERSDGSAYTLPITLATAEKAWDIPQKSELINQTSMTADADGHPYIATYWRDADSTVPQYRLVWHDGSRWRAEQVGHRTTPFSLAGGGTKMIPISRPRLVSDGHKAYYIFRDQERGSRVSVATTPSLGSGKWTVTDVTPFSVDAWEPTLDIALWNSRGLLNVFVQTNHQGDGERTVDGSTATPVYVAEIK